MRKLVLIGAMLLAGLAGSIAVVPTATAAPGRDVPTCLLSNGGNRHGYTKTVTCAEVLHQRYEVAGAGRYSGGGFHILTVTLQERYDRDGYAGWVPVAAASAHGFGTLTVVTHGVRAHRAELRACSTVSGARVGVCTAP